MLFSINSLYAADRYWVLGGGTWSDFAAHWSATSGGPPGATLPSDTDNVFFDVNSGLPGVIIIDVDTAFASIWTGPWHLLHW